MLNYFFTFLELSLSSVGFCRLLPVGIFFGLVDLWRHGSFSFKRIVVVVSLIFEPLEVDGFEFKPLDVVRFEFEAPDVEGFNFESFDGFEPLEIHWFETLDVGGFEPLDIDGFEPLDVDGSDPFDVDGSETLDVGGFGFKVRDIEEIELETFDEFTFNTEELGIEGAAEFIVIGFTVKPVAIGSNVSFFKGELDVDEELVSDEEVDSEELDELPDVSLLVCE